MIVGPSSVAKAVRPILLESAKTTARVALRAINELTLASPSSCTVGPTTGSMPLTPMNAMSIVIRSSTTSLYGPTSSYDLACTTPPVTTVLICGRITSWAAMLMALVTTVRLGCGDGSMRSGREPSTLATAVLVVPPQRPTTDPRGTRALAACAIRSFSGACCSRL